MDGKGVTNNVREKRLSRERKNNTNNIMQKYSSVSNIIVNAK
jgi:hypothetical protein